MILLKNAGLLAGGVALCGVLALAPARAADMMGGTQPMGQPTSGMMMKDAAPMKSDGMTKMPSSQMATEKMKAGEMKAGAMAGEKMAPAKDMMGK